MVETATIPSIEFPIPLPISFSQLITFPIDENPIARDHEFEYFASSWFPAPFNPPDAPPPLGDWILQPKLCQPDWVEGQFPR